MDINEVIELGDETVLRRALEDAKALAKKGDIIALIDFLCPEDVKVRPSKNWNGVKKRETFDIVETKKGHSRVYHDD